MHQEDLLHNLRFERRIPAIPPLLVRLGVTFVAFILLWNILPSSGFFWLLLITTLVLVWLAGYGRRQAMGDLIAFLQRLQRME